jgi:glycosyltransferase involved in cell wall biosynthesis
MKILLVVNIPLPETSELFNLKVGNSGGWLIGLINSLTSYSNIELNVAFPLKGNKVIKRTGKKINYYSFPQYKNKEYSPNIYDDKFENILKDVKPDLVHVFGTELPHSLAIVNTCNRNGVVSIVSIQGLVSKIHEHFYSDLPKSVIHKSTIRNVIRRDNIKNLKKLYFRLSKNEHELLRRTSYVIGRTTFDKAYVTQVNPNVKYYSCNESLRDAFYEGEQWQIETKENHSIFLSQAHYSIKGAHYMIEALSIVLEKYPDAKVYIGGKDITKSNSLKDKLIITYYGKYIKNMICDFGLTEKVIFTGPLSEQEMYQRYIESHVFVCPSSIENSPNSLGEAMILGVPSIASYVGGIPDMLKDKEDGFLYQHDAPYMLAHYICEIFENRDLALKFSINAREHALKTHDRNENTRSLIEIYNKIVSQ